MIGPLLWLVSACVITPAYLPTPHHLPAAVALFLPLRHLPTALYLHPLPVLLWI